ncbi:unnamed protein product [Knipowitschia caucasica]
MTEEAVKRANRNNDVDQPLNLSDVHTECTDRQRTGAAGPLSTSQLIIRRGITVLSAAGLFALGLTIHLIVPLPEPYINSTNSFRNISNPIVHNVTNIQ